MQFNESTFIKWLSRSPPCGNPQNPTPHTRRASTTCTSASTPPHSPSPSPPNPEAGPSYSPEAGPSRPEAGPSRMQRAARYLCGSGSARGWIHLNGCSRSFPRSSPKTRTPESGTRNTKRESWGSFVASLVIRRTRRCGFSALNTLVFSSNDSYYI